MGVKLAAWISMLVLALALLPLPYGYYFLLRALVCGSCIYLANGDAQTSRIRWAWVLGGIALLYNPIFRIHLNRDVWSFINLATIWLLAIHMWATGRWAAQDSTP